MDRSEIIGIEKLLEKIKNLYKKRC